MTAACTPWRRENTSAGFTDSGLSPPSSLIKTATGGAASLNRSGSGSGNLAEIDRNYFAMISKTAPRCAVCSRDLGQNPKDGYSYQAPFVPPSNHCPEHGYPWQQFKIEEEAEISPATAFGTKKTYPTSP